MPLRHSTCVFGDLRQFAMVLLQFLLELIANICCQKCLCTFMPYHGIIAKIADQTWELNGYRCAKVYKIHCSKCSTCLPKGLDKQGRPRSDSFWRRQRMSWALICAMSLTPQTGGARNQTQNLWLKDRVYQLHLMAPGHLCLRSAMYPYLECPSRMWCWGPSCWWGKPSRAI